MPPADGHKRWQAIGDDDQECLRQHLRKGEDVLIIHCPSPVRLVLVADFRQHHPKLLSSVASYSARAVTSVRAGAKRFCLRHFVTV